MKGRKIIRLLLILVLAATLIVVGWRQLDYWRGAADSRDAEETAGLPEPEEVPPAKEGEPDPWLALLAEVDLESLREVNKEVVAWITIPDTDLSYPVVHHGDNRYYLKRTWKGNRSAAGSIFLEGEASGDFREFSTLIYGHKMNNGSMFGSLWQYQDPDYWREHPAVYLVHDGGICRYEVYAAFEAELDCPVYRLAFPTPQSREELINWGLEHSAIDTGIVPKESDRILTLSTCTGRGHAKRWVIQAVLAEQAER